MGSARTTLARRTAAARGFSAWAHRCGLLAADVAAQLATPKAHRELLDVLRSERRLAFQYPHFAINARRGRCV